MAVRFRCPCGAFLRAGEEHIDTIRPCPYCETNIRVPPAPAAERDCAMCKKPIPPSHTIWVRGRRVCWKCMPPGSVKLDLNAFQEHRKAQLETIRRAKTQGLHFFQYQAPYGATHNEVQVTADEVVFDEQDWDRITPVWREHGLIPFDMGNFMGVSMSAHRFLAQAEDSKKYLEPLLALVKNSDELPLASVPKDPGASTVVYVPKRTPK